MKKSAILITIMMFASAYSLVAQDLIKPRVLVLTDIENEPDDAESMVRFMLYSNHFDVEGLCATTSRWLRDRTAEWRIKEIVEAYGKVRDILLQHETGYPTQDFLLARIKRGIPEYGLDGVGPGKDSEASEWLISVVDKPDPRPVWVTVWGGPNVLAQALWKVRDTRTPAELAEFVSKIRVYTISDQDNSAIWIRNEFPYLFYIVSPGTKWVIQTWSGISGEPWYGFASGADTTIVQNPWLRENVIEKHGPLGAEYPELDYAMEGDTPSFLGLVNNGLNVPERPDFGGWGGRYELYQPRFLPYQEDDFSGPETRPIWTNANDEVVGKDGRTYIDNRATIWRWRDAYQHDFAARMDWCVMPYSDANHPPIARIEGSNEVSVRVGEAISLDASTSSDPDGDELSYRWFHYAEPGSYWHWHGLTVTPGETGKVTISVDERVDTTIPKDTHVILEVTDGGHPSLTRYQRIIVNVLPADRK